MASWDHDDLRSRAYDERTGVLITADDEALLAIVAGSEAASRMVQPEVPTQYELLNTANEADIERLEARTSEAYRQIEALNSERYTINREIDARREMRVALRKLIAIKVS